VGETRTSQARALALPRPPLVFARPRVRRGAIATTALGLVTGVLFLATLMIGSAYVPLPDVLRSLSGIGSNPGTDFLVLDLQLPIALSALLAGGALGLAGAIFQRLLANPLAAPDLIGISYGASAGAVVAILILQLGGLAVSGAALVGALAVAALIYALAWRGGVSGYRLILIGIGTSQFLLGVVFYLVARAELYDAREAMHWLVGSAGRADWTELYVLGAGLCLLVPVAWILTRSLRALELGDESARALGARVETMRLALIAVAVTLVALATAVAGPLAFVGLVAWPVARRLIGSGEGGVLAVAFVGAITVLGADLISQQLLPVALPTGVVTGAVGAPYLLWLLATMNRGGIRG
jgi:iron complex transport system permease protein